jgi:DNA-binding beta-propeller fold protein YncE
LRSDSKAVITYTVTNNTISTISKLIIDPSYQIRRQSSGISLQNDHCSNATLAGNASCTFQVLVNGSNASGSFTLSPRVCGFGGTVCSQPVSSNRVSVQLTMPRVAAQAYVGLETVNELQPINALTETLQTAVSGFNFASISQGIAVANNGSKVFVANGNANDVIIYNVSTSTLTTINHAAYTQIPTNFTPVGVVASPDNTRLYLTDHANGAVYVFNIAASIPSYVTTVNLSSFMTGPHGIDVSPDGTTVYVVNGENVTPNYAAAINTTTFNVRYFNTDTFSLGALVSPDGTQLYVANGASGSGSNIQIFNTSNLAATPVTVTLSGLGPHGMAISPDGNTLYAADTNESSPGKVSIITGLSTPSPAHVEVNVDNNPAGVAVTPDGSKVYVATESDFVDVINTSNNNVTRLAVSGHQTSLGRFVG